MLCEDEGESVSASNSTFKGLKNLIAEGEGGEAVRLKEEIALHML